MAADPVATGSSFVLCRCTQRTAMFCYFMSQLVRPMRIPALALAGRAKWRMSNGYTFVLFLMHGSALVKLTPLYNTRHSAPEIRCCREGCRRSAWIYMSLYFIWGTTHMCSVHVKPLTGRGRHLVCCSQCTLFETA